MDASRGRISVKGRHRRPGRWPVIRVRTAALAAAVLALPVALFGVSGSAQATTAPFVPVTDFVIDGNPAGPNDFDAPYGPGTTPEGHPTTGIYYNHRNIDMGATTGLTTGCALANFGFVDDAAGSGVKIEDGPI